MQRGVGALRGHAARVTLAFAIAAGLGGCIGYDGDFDRGYQIDERTYSQVKIGSTTKEQALSLMGTPSTTSTVGGDAWYYIGQKMHRALAFMPVQMEDRTCLLSTSTRAARLSASP